MFMQDIPLESEVHTTLSPKSVSSLPLFCTFCMCGFMCLNRPQSEGGRGVPLYQRCFSGSLVAYTSKGIKNLKKLMTSF